MAEGEEKIYQGSFLKTRRDGEGKTVSHEIDTSGKTVQRVDKPKTKKKSKKSDDPGKRRTLPGWIPTFGGNSHTEDDQRGRD